MILLVSFMGATRTHLIRSEKQLAALTAATRQEVVDVLEQLGTVSVGELAAALGRPADALYFHLRALTRAGLVRRAGYRLRPRGKEALYCTVAPELELHYEPHRASNRRAVSAIVSSMLRLATRDFRRAFRHDTVVVGGPRRELWGWRKAGRLSPTGLAEVNRRIKGLAKAVSAPSKRGRLYAITVVLTPLDHRNKIESSSRRNTKSK
jgi:DNA-binding transcriptional ArsR family regulator